MALTNLLVGIKFEHHVNLLELRSLVTTIDREVACDSYYGSYILSKRGIPFLEINKHYVTIIAKSHRRTMNRILAGLGTAIHITRDWMVER